MEKRIAVLGLGIENLALVQYLINCGKNVTICDRSDFSRLKERIGDLNNNSKIKLQLGPHYLENLEDYSILYRSPGLPLFDPKLESAIKNGVKVTSAMREFMELCPCTTIGVTGTKGKGTTSSLIYNILKIHNQMTGEGNVYLGGNIGIAPFSFLKRLTSKDVVILELSSFQLEDMEQSPNIAVITNITEDHLVAADPNNPNYHKSLNDYVQAKTNIYKHQNSCGTIILNFDDPTSLRQADKVPGKLLSYGSKSDLNAWYTRRSNGGFTIFWRVKGSYERLIESEQIQIRGEHNLLNISAAALASNELGASYSSIVEGISSFTGLEHRLEYVNTINGIEFFDDSFASAPDPTIVALRAFQNPVVLIVGGADKGANFTGLADEILKHNIRSIILIGTTGPKIGATIKDISKAKGLSLPTLIKGGNNMHDIVVTAINQAQPGDVVLLSTACASFGLFNNYKERGNLFKAEVQSYLESR